MNVRTRLGDGVSRPVPSSSALLQVVFMHTYRVSLTWDATVIQLSLAEKPAKCPYEYPKPYGIL